MKSRKTPSEDRDISVPYSIFFHRIYIKRPLWKPYEKKAKKE